MKNKAGIQQAVIATQKSTSFKYSYLKITMYMVHPTCDVDVMSLAVGLIVSLISQNTNKLVIINKIANILNSLELLMPIHLSNTLRFTFNNT